jgi:hypothetical protein
MEPWQQRVVDEKAELDAKIERLRTFCYVNNRGFLSLFEEDRDLLRCQYEAMRQYSSILDRRIARFDR